MSGRPPVVAHCGTRSEATHEPGKRAAHVTL